VKSSVRCAEKKEANCILFINGAAPDYPIKSQSSVSFSQVRASPRQTNGDLNDKAMVLQIGHGHDVF
jgi:hypothetical protein